MEDDNVVRFQATVAQVKTMADGGLRLSLDLSEKEILAATKMMQCKQGGAILEIAAVPIVLQQENNAISKGKKRKSEWSSPEEAGAN